MTKFDYDIGVIGGGAAGLTVASGASQLGAKTLLVEKEKKLGGDCLHYGCVPSKTLIKTASVYQLMKESRDYGLPGVSPEAVDFTRVAARIKTVINRIQEHDSVDRFCRLGVRVEFGPARFIDEHTVEVGGRKFTAAVWVITGGSSPSAPPVPGLDEVSYLTNREIFSLDRLPESLIVLGGGPIAIEMAQAFNRLGSRVEVVQRSKQILSREDRDMAELVMAKMGAEGVRFHLDTRVTGVREAGGEVILIYEDNNAKEIQVRGEKILVALGRRPNTDGLGLDDIDIEYDRRGIKVDSHLRTGHKHIYAAGDINGVFQFTHVAGYEAGVVVSNAVFHLPRRVNYDLVPWCTYTRPELASIGINEKAAVQADIDHRVVVEEFAANDRHLAEGGGEGQIKLILGKKDKPLGVQILGIHAGDLLAEWVCAMNGKVGLSTIAAAIHPYPTLGEINKRVCGTILAEKIFSARVKKALTFFFNLRGRACFPDGDAAGEEKR